MAKIGIVWELGVASGHLARLAPLAHALAARGHETHAIVPRDAAEDAAPLFAGIALHAAPARCTAAIPIARPHSYAEILHNEGWSDVATLAPRIAAWRRLLASLRADLLVCDSSPGALLAAQGLGVATAVLGTGFSCPPDLSPLPDLRPWEPVYTDRVRLREARVVAAIDACLAERGLAPVERVGALFARADARWLATLPALDHFPEREGGDYVGVWGRLPGDAPQWPADTRPRVLAYLHGFEALPELLAHWQRRDANVLVHFGMGVDAALRARPSRGIRVAERPLEIAAAARDCDLAVIHGGHDTTAHLLRAGRPLLLIPLQAEQARLAMRVAGAGAGLFVAPNDAASLCRAFDRIGRDAHFGDAARAFAERHADVDAERALAAVVERIEALLAARALGGPASYARPRPGGAAPIHRRGEG